MNRRGGYSLRELAELTGAMLIGDPEYQIYGYADLESAKKTDVSFFAQPRYTETRYASLMLSSQAGAIFVTETAKRSSSHHYLIHANPSTAFQKIVEIFCGRREESCFPGIDPSSILHESAQIGQDVRIGPLSVVDAEASIGEGSFIGAGCYIGPHVRIGKHCQIHPRVTIQAYTEIGDRVIIESGAVLGSCGFGFATDEKGHHRRIKQLGKVVIENDVEIGANTTIDRARFTETRVGEGSKLDNLVTVGHNVRIGRHTIICGQAGIAGSTKIGNHVVIAGQCGINGHIAIDDGVILAAKSGVTKSLSKGKYSGYPAEPTNEFNRTQATLRKLCKERKHRRGEDES